MTLGFMLTNMLVSAPFLARSSQHPWSSLPHRQHIFFMLMRQLLRSPGHLRMEVITNPCLL